MGAFCSKYFHLAKLHVPCGVIQQFFVDRSSCCSPWLRAKLLYSVPATEVVTVLECIPRGVLENLRITRTHTCTCIQCTHEHALTSTCTRIHTDKCHSLFTRTHTHTHGHLYARTYISTSACRTHGHAHTYKNTHTGLHATTHTYTCTWIHARTRTHMHTHLAAHTCAHTRIHTCTCALQPISPHTNPRTSCRPPFCHCPHPAIHPPSLQLSNRPSHSATHPRITYPHTATHAPIYAAILVQCREKPCRRRSGIADWMRAKDWEQSREALMVEFMLPWTNAPSGLLL